MGSSSTSQKISVAARRLLDTQGADAVTIRSVAKAVGITPMAIYRHYPGRDALLNALADKGFEELAACLRACGTSGSVVQRMIKLGQGYLDHALENPGLFELMFVKPRAGARQYPNDFEVGASPTANVLAEVVREGIERGIFRQDDVWEIAFELGALSHGLIMLYFGRRMRMSETRFRKFYNRSLERYIRGIRR